MQTTSSQSKSFGNWSSAAHEHNNIRYDKTRDKIRFFGFYKFKLLTVDGYAVALGGEVIGVNRTHFCNNASIHSVSSLLFWFHGIHFFRSL